MARNNFSSFRVLGFNVRNLENVLHQDVEVDLQENHEKTVKIADFRFHTIIETLTVFQSICNVPEPIVERHGSHHAFWSH